MKANKLFLQIFILYSVLNIYSSQTIKLNSSESYYYDEKYFRILTNNYDPINPGNVWNNRSSDGIGFKPNNNFGSIILLKDWSMYNFKLTQVLFRKECSFKYEDFDCSAEMWLYHTKDNQYYPPGRRIYLKQNFFVIVVPFLVSDNENPGNDEILDYLNLERYSQTYKDPNILISPKKPVKLYQIIQNQPSYLFDGKYNNADTLFMVFAHYHYISAKMYNILQDISRVEINKNITQDSDKKIYRNVRKLEEIKPRATLLAYSNAIFLKNFLAFLVLFLI